MSSLAQKRYLANMLHNLEYHRMLVFWPLHHRMSYILIVCPGRLYKAQQRDSHPHQNHRLEVYRPSPSELDS